MQVFWFKRDLRLEDNSPFSEAVKAGPVLPIFIHEPDIICARDYAVQHHEFIAESLEELSHNLAIRGIALKEFSGSAPATLETIWQHHPFVDLWSHQEVGNGASYARDKAVAAWCRGRGVTWHQLPQNGVIRGTSGSRSQRQWLAQLEDYMAEPPLAAPAKMMPTILDAVMLPSDDKLSPAGEDKPGRLRGGRARAMKLLDTFLNQRILQYPSDISSPLTAETGCSRLSPYLAYGVLSAREVVAAMNKRIDLLDEGASTYERERLVNALRFFADRLRWRFGYFQNMESQPQLEFENLNRRMDGLRESEFNQAYFSAWKDAKTGYPMVDAAMEMLRHTGWVNMRMRGMLLSFAVNDLWLHWREPALFLAQEFLDYEPAIHYNQMQIHAGTAGGPHTLTYNVVKQAQDLDAGGVFVRRWLPVLRDVPFEYIFEPWTMPDSVQATCGVKIGLNYPAPVVNASAASRRARTLVAEAQKAIAGKSASHIQRKQAALSADSQLALF